MRLILLTGSLNSIRYIDGDKARNTYITYVHIYQKLILITPKGV